LTYEEIKRPLVAVSESLRRFAGPARVFNSEEAALAGLGESTYIVTERRFSGYGEGPSIGYLSPEAAAGGTIALVEDTVYRI
jgi:dihydroxy-acid dehydratase